MQRIYFIADTALTAVKIGIASSPETRMKDLQVGTYADLELLATMAGDRELERRLHEQFRDRWIRGEWFAPCPELLFLIDQLRLEAAQPPLLGWDFYRGLA